MRLERLEQEEKGEIRPTVVRYSKAQKRFVHLPKYVPPTSSWKCEFKMFNREAYKKNKEERKNRVVVTIEDDKEEEAEVSIRKWTHSGDPNLDMSDDEFMEEYEETEHHRKTLPILDIAQTKKKLYIDKEFLKETVEALGMEYLDNVTLVDSATNEVLLPNTHTL